MPRSTRRVFQFGPFELLTTPTVLSREGGAVSITPKALSLLLELVTHRDRAMSKDDLLSAVWGETAVEEASLSQNVYLLRKLLAPDFPGQVTIENIPRVGYRFRLPVEEADLSSPTGAHATTPQPESGVGPDQLSGSAPLATGSPDSTRAPDAETKEQPGVQMSRRRRYVRWVVAAAVLCVLVVVIWEWPISQTLRSRQAAYQWTRFTSNAEEDRVAAVALSPDGNLAVYADADGVVLRPTRSTATHLLPSPKLKYVDRLWWFPDQLHVLASGEDALTGAQQLWKISVLGEAPILLREGARLGTVSSDGEQIAFLSDDSSQVWVMGAAGEGGRRVATADGGEHFSVLLWDRGNEGLLLERRATWPGEAQTDKVVDAPLRSKGSGYERVRVADGKVTGRDEGLSMGDACLLADGDLIFSVSTPREGREAVSLWRVALEAGNGALRSSPQQIFKLDDTNHFYGFSCSADGKAIATRREEGVIGVFVADLAKNPLRLLNARRLSMDSTSAFPHGWKSDSKAVLYEASRADNDLEIFSQHLGRHDPDGIVTMDGSNARPTPTPDHQWILFTHRSVPHGPWQLYRAATENPSPVAVPSGGLDLTDFRCPLLKGSCLVMTHNGDGAEISMLSPESGKGEAVFNLPASLDRVVDWDVSPDGTRVVLAGRGAIPLHVITLKTGKVSEVPYRSSGMISAANWASSGAGFYVGSVMSQSNGIAFVDLAGNATTLRTTGVGTWVVPSPDGRKVAFVERIVNSNMWLLQQK